MNDRFLNVQYGSITAEVDITGMSRLGVVKSAIKDELSNSLAQVDAPQLQLYTNSSRDQLINTWASLDSLHQEYFTEGGSCVVIGTLPSTQVSLFPPCQIPFYSDISKAADLNRWLWFAQDIPSSTLKRLYIRESYKTIASSIQQEKEKYIITGTPGIGKSLFMIYLLWKLVKAGKRVLFVYHPVTIYYDGKGGVFELTSLPSVVDHSFWSSDLWCLFDAKGKKEENLSAFPYGDCTFVLSMSPRREMVNDFKKPPTPQTFYMPLWNKAELETIAPSFPGVADWQKRFLILGGIPRHVLEVTSDNPIELLQAACRQCKLDDCIKIVGLDSTIKDNSKVVHSLVHITSTSPFTESSVSYASETALDIIVANKGADAKKMMVGLLESLAGNPLTASLCGYIFEPYTFELLEKGGDFTCRQLVDGRSKLDPADTILHIPPSTRMVADKVEDGQTQNQLYIPKTKNNAVIDAWIPGIGGFQMTVGKTHDIKVDAKGARRDLELLGNKLYFLIPPLHFRTFTKKAPGDIDQYAVKIPYPRVDE